MGKDNKYSTFHPIFLGLDIDNDNTSRSVTSFDYNISRGREFGVYLDSFVGGRGIGWEGEGGEVRKLPYG